MTDFKNKLISNISIIKTVITSVLFLGLCFSSIFIGENTVDAKLYHWSNSVNNYYNNPSTNPNSLPMLRLESDEKKVMQDVFNQYYYTNSSTVVSSLRQYTTTNTYLKIDDTNFDFCLNYQNVFSIQNKLSVGYYLEYGIFATYYKDEYLPNRQYLERRFGANGFCFISDTLATKLKNYYYSKYGVVVTDKDLFTNEKYALIDFYAEGYDFHTTLCINNILYSSQRNGPRVNELYGDFALAYGDQLSTRTLKYCCEFDLKSDTYGTSRLVKDLNELGYTRDNSVYTIYSPTSGGYQLNTELTKNLASINFNENPVIFYVVCSLIALAYFILIIIFKKKSFFCCVITALMFIILCIINIFIGIAPISMIYPSAVAFIVIVLSIVLGFNIFKKKGEEDELKI